MLKQLESTNTHTDVSQLSYHVWLNNNRRRHHVERSDMMRLPICVSTKDTDTHDNMVHSVK